MKTVLVIPDAHVTPNDDLRRFECLAKMVNDLRPDTLVQLGDFATMESLSHWDLNKRLLIEGRRIREDLDAANKAWGFVETMLRTVQTAQRHNKEKIYKPKLLWFVGNHEDWLPQWIERNPEMKGMIDLKRELGLTDDLYSNLDWVNWKEHRIEDGILYTHVPIGRTGPISSKYITARCVSDYSNLSVVFGHTHRRQDDSIARICSDVGTGSGGLRVIRAVNAGCFFEKWPHYAEGNNNDYWQGLILLRVWDSGRFDVDEWSLERIYYNYG